MSLRDLFLNLSVAKERFYVPEIDGEVEIRGITARQRTILYDRAMTFDKKGRPKVDMAVYKALLLTMSVYDPSTGEPVFGEGDMDAIADLPGSIVERLAVPAMDLSGLGLEAEQEAEKN